MSDESVERAELIAALLGPIGPEVTCEECFEQLDRYVDVTLSGHDGDQAVPGMRAHLLGCPACADDYDSLLAYLSAEDAPPAVGASET